MKNFSAKVLSQNFQYYVPRNVKNTFGAFETSWETDNLESEDKRNIHCELIDWRRDSNWNINKSILPSNKITTDNAKVDDYEEDDDNVEHKSAINDNQAKWWTEIELKGENFIDSLSFLILKKLAENFRGGRINENIVCQDHIIFGRLINLDLPLRNLFDVENEVFWRRMVELKIKDQFRLQNLIKNDETNWKKIGIELMFTEFVENLQVSDVLSPTIRPSIDDLTQKCAEYIENLAIRKVYIKTERKKDIYNPFLIIRNYKNDEASHVSLDFLKPLKNLKKLSISFEPQITHEMYERRFYQVSILDIANLSQSLQNFIHLETLEITKTSLEQHEKIFHLLSSIAKLPCLQVLMLTHCNISSRESGAIFESYLSNNLSLKEINLKDNELDSAFCYHFSLGMKNFQNILQKLTLSMNAILHDGLEYIISSISDKDNVIDLDISSCDGFSCSSYGTTFKNLCNLLYTSKNLHHLNLSNNIITSEFQRQSFIEALERNYSIYSISCSNCDFSTKEELDIHVLVLRNEYYMQNKILKKETFTREDELEIEKWLRRTKHPLLLKARTFMPTENLIKWKNQANKILCKQAGKDYEKFVFF